MFLSRDFSFSKYSKWRNGTVWHLWLHDFIPWKSPHPPLLREGSNPDFLLAPATLPRVAEPQAPGFKAYESSNTENIGLDKKKTPKKQKLRKNAGFVLFFLVLFFW